MGVVAVLVHPPVAAVDPRSRPRRPIGIGTGLALYLGTRVFVWIASRWTPFRRDVLDQYGQAGEVTLARSLVLSLAIMVPAEELFWRGLFQGPRSGHHGERGGSDRVACTSSPTSRAAACRSWPGRSSEAPSGEPSHGGRGVLASLASHILWTGLMLAFPPGAGRPAIEGGSAR